MKGPPKYLTVKQPDGSVWGVPAEMIARNRAEFYAHLHGNNVEQSLQNNTAPLFISDPSEILYWASQKMRWSDFDGHQVQLSPPEPVDFQKGWLSGEKGLAPETPPVGESQLEKQYAYLKRQVEFFRQIKSVSESARRRPYLLLIYSEDEVLGVIGGKGGLSLGLSTEGAIDLLGLPLSCVIMHSGIVSKIFLSPVSGSGPCLEMKAGTYAMYEQQIAELGYSYIIAKLASLYVQEGELFVINYSKIRMSGTAFT